MASRLSGQGTLDFGLCEPVRPPKAERFFFALLLGAGRDSERIHQFGSDYSRRHHLGGRYLNAERLHVSLHHVGDFDRPPAKVIYAAALAAESVLMEQLTMTFSRIGTFEAPPSRDRRTLSRPLVLLEDGGEVIALYKRLGAAMLAHGLKPSPVIRPHLTLAYGSSARPFEEIETIRIVADSFQLIHSERGLTRYNVLGSWPLRAATGPDLTSTLLEVL